MTSLILENVYKAFGATKVLEGINWEIQDNEFMVLVGPSGSGKTTLLRIILGTLKPDIGHVYMDKTPLTDVPIAERGIGFVPQDFGLFPHLTGYENIAYGLRIRLYSDKKIDKRVKELMKMLKLDGLEKRKPNQLSWGQQQRVALARALAIEPKLLLLDEPLSSVDWTTREEITQDIKRLQKKVRVTTVYVTHDIDEAFELGQRVTIINQGKLEQCGTPEELMVNPKTPFVTYFTHRRKGVAEKNTHKKH